MKFLSLALLSMCSAAAMLLAPSASHCQTSKKPSFTPLPMEFVTPKDNAATPEKVALGKQLFFDPRLSGDNKMSCATCHDPAKAFADGLPLAKGHAGKTLSRRTPSLLNIGLYSAYTWDGRARSLEEQALGPIQSPDEMNQNLDELETELNAVPGYVKQFDAVFKTKATRDGIGKALAAFQRTLVTKPAPFDRYLKGDKNALSPDAWEGMRLFMREAGCIQCHSGPALSDNKFYRLGVGTGDKGRGAITGKKEDNYKFRTPSLRMLSPDGPYMHDGSQKTLQDVVTFYYRGVSRSPIDALQLDVEPLISQSFSEVPLVVAFLESLIGEAPKVAPPELPK